MPLVKGKSEEARRENVSRLRKEGKALDQALAISYDIQRRARAKNRRGKGK